MEKKITVIRSSAVPLPMENIDTDQIMPARFLKATSREGFGDNLFRDWRYRPDGSLNPDFVLNRREYSGCILVAGRNFGNGSSREHAAWGLHDYGFRVVVSSFFADIHKNNELNNFVLPVTVPEEFLSDIFATIQANPRAEFRVDLPAQTFTNLTNGRSESFDINPYKKECLLCGLDDVEYLLSQSDKIDAYEASHPYC